MKNDRSSTDFPDDGAGRYPHLKLTAETFPRILATRRIEDDEAEYFGAFLTRTAVRILIDFLNRTFRLRSCDIEVDGSFPVPCTQYYRRRCLAPCVISLCDSATYRDRVDLVRMFLADRRGDLTSALRRRIETSSEDLEFEEAARWRDMLLAVENYWENPRWQVWLDDTVDIYEADETIAGSFIYLVTQRGRNILGRKVFRLPRGGGLPAHEALEDIITTFYLFHLPAEIRVSMDFEGREVLMKTLSERFGRPARIVLSRPDRQRVTAARALQSTWSENELEFLKEKTTGRQIAGELKRSFGLPAVVSRVEAFDVAHISGKHFVTASTVWENGVFLPEEHRFYVSAETTEPAALAEVVKRRLEHTGFSRPDLIILDGGRSQLNAVIKALAPSRDTDIALVGAVKPAGRHSSLSYFILETGERVEYEADNPAHNMVRLLRDAAHDLANRVHRDIRDMVHHYELAALLPSLTEAERLKLVSVAGSLRKIRETDLSGLEKSVGTATVLKVRHDLANGSPAATDVIIPFVVPIRFDADGGNAEDLIPIEVR